MNTPMTIENTNLTLAAQDVLAEKQGQISAEGCGYSGLSRRASAARSAGLVRWVSNPAW